MYDADLPLWIALNHHRNTSDQRMQFGYGHELFLPIYMDKAPVKVFKKCVQIGISEYLICTVMAHLHLGSSVLYTLPTVELRNTFVANRIDPLLLSVPFYRDGVQKSKGDSDARGLKHIWQGSAKFVGTNSPVSFLEYMADYLVIDEKDASNLKLLVKADDRQQHSILKAKTTVANPTLPNFGIDVDWSESDQKLWYVPCPHCGQMQFIGWFTHVVREIDEGRYEPRCAEYVTRAGKKIVTEAFPVCEYCEKWLNRRAYGEWIPQADSDISGYHLTNVYNNYVTLAQLCNDFDRALFDTTLYERFVNSQLGETFRAPGSSLTKEILDKHSRSDYIMRPPVIVDDDKAEVKLLITAGVDVNFPQLNVRISIWPKPDVRKAIFIGTVHGFTELNILLDKYRVDFVCIDIAPERNKVTDWIKEGHNRWAISYPTRTAKFDNREGWRVDNDSKIITVERTRWIDKMIAAIYTGCNLLPKNYASIEDNTYLEQIEAPVRRIDEEKYPPVAYWDCPPSKADHFFHTEVYDLIAGAVAKLIGDLRPRITTLGA